MGEHPTTTESQRRALLQSVSVPGSQPGRAVLQQDQAVSACG